jgi:hypothetical protein
MTTITTTAVAKPLIAADFYSWMAVACVLTAFLGFIPTYWTPLAAGQFTAHPVVHMHGIAFFSWTIFALVQTSLVPAGRVALHRSVGLAGISIATLLTVLGLLAALNSLLGSFAVGRAYDAEAFLIVPLSIIATFGVLFTLAIANIRRPEIHKRLMLMATVSVLNAPVARPLLTWVWPLNGPTDVPPVWINVPACWLSYLLIVAAMIYDWRTRGRPHTVYLIALPILVVLAAAVIPISETQTWHAIARDYALLAGGAPAAPG